MRSVSLEMLHAMMAESTGEVLLAALTITHADLIAPIKVVNDSVPLVRGAGGATAYDMSGNGFNGTITSATQSVIDRRAARLFAKTGSIVASSIVEVSRLLNYTVEAWVRPVGAALSRVNNCVFQSSLAADNRNGLNIHDGHARFGFYNGTSWLGASGPVVDGKWVLLSCVNDGGALRLYIDGVLQSGTLAPYAHSTTGFHLGRNTEAVSGDWFDGYIGETRVWSHARTQEQIKKHAYDMLDGDEPGLVAYWPMQDDVFIGFPFRPVLPSDTEDELPVLTIQVDNVDRRISKLLNELSGVPRVSFEVILASSPNVVEAGPYEMDLKMVNSTADVLDATLSFEDILNQGFPKDTFTPQNSLGLFRG